MYTSSITHANLESVVGIEPTSSLWQREILPLNYTDLVAQVGLEPTNSEEEGFTVPCNCRYATEPLLKIV